MKPRRWQVPAPRLIPGGSGRYISSVNAKSYLRATRRQGCAGGRTPSPPTRSPTYGSRRVPTRRLSFGGVTPARWCSACFCRALEAGVGGAHFRARFGGSRIACPSRQPHRKMGGRLETRFQGCCGRKTRAISSMTKLRARMPAQMLALDRAASAQHRSSNANSLGGQNSAGSRKSMRPFKGIICDDVSEFESHMPSQAVRSLWAMSGLQKYARHSRELARRHAVSEA